MPQKCPFCQILEGKQDSEKVYEDSNVLGVLDIRPSAPGHTLVIPKEHTPTVTDLSESMVDSIFEATREVIKKLEKALNADGFNVGWNHGKAAGQAIPHLHVHVMPRFEDDKGGPVQAVVRNEPEEEVSSIADRIRNAGKARKQSSRVSREAQKKKRKEGEKSEEEGELEEIPEEEHETGEEESEEEESEEEGEEGEDEGEKEKVQKKKWKEMKKPRY